MRPRYESSNDLDNEREVISVIEKAWKVESVKLPISYGLDFALLRDGQVKAFAEVKRRKNNADKYPSIFVAMHKCLQAIQYKALGYPCYFVVKWNDKTGWVDLLNGQTFASIGGRVDRGDSADQEPMVHFPMSEVTFL